MTNDDGTMVKSLHIWQRQRQEPYATENVNIKISVNEKAAAKLL